jgi:hypothetical protein
MTVETLVYLRFNHLALRIGRLYPPPSTKYSWCLFLSEDVVRLEELFQRKIQMTATGKQTRDLPACSAVPQQTTPPRMPSDFKYCPKTFTMAVAQKMTVDSTYTNKRAKSNMKRYTATSNTAPHQRICPLDIKKFYLICGTNCLLSY